MRPPRRQRIRVATWVAMLVAMLGFAGCEEPGEPPAPIRIGFVDNGSMPGGGNQIGTARLAVEVVNGRGGVELAGRTHPVELVVETTSDSPEGAVRATLELVNRQGVVAIIGSSFSRNAIPSSVIAEQSGIPMISPGATHPDLTAGRRFVFRVAIVDSVHGRVMARFARKELGLSRAAVLYDVTDPYSRGIAAVFRQIFEEAGGRVAMESFTFGTEDLQPQLERLRATEPEALFLPGFIEDRLAHQTRLAGIDAVLLGTESWLPVPPDLEEIDGAYLTMSWHPGFISIFPQAAELDELFRAAFGNRSNGLAALTYDAVGLVLDAIARAGKAEPAAIRDALAATVGYPGATGPITYRGLGGDPGRYMAIGRFVDGELELIQRWLHEG